MDALQNELDITHPEVEIELIGVNQAGFDAANEQVCDGRDIPWLQDMPEVLAWESWGVTFRDLYILDADNRPFAVFNLTDHNLQVPTEYEALRDLLLEAAGYEQQE